MKHIRTTPACLIAALSLAPLAAQVNVLTFHNNNARTGQNVAETILTPANVKAATFGKIFLATLDGKVDAQPLIASGISVAGQGTHNVLVAATENDSLYALDASTGATLWQTALLNTGETPSDNLSCNQVKPIIGITSTPVISLNGSGGGTIYAVAMSKDGSGNYHQRLHAVDIASGSEILGGPVDIQAQYPGAGEGSSGGFVVFNPKQYVERAALLLLDGTVYLSWSSHCDHPPYTGWIMGYDAATLAQTSVIDVTPNGAEGSIWGSGAGPSADSKGNIYFLDANGTFDTTLNAQGFPANGDFGNSFIKLSTTGGQLAVADYFAMYNTVSESEADLDLGSGGSMVLPNMKNAAGKEKQLALGAGKDGNIYIVDRTKMGKFNPANDNAIYQELSGAFPSSSQIKSTPAFFNDHVYYCAISDRLKAFAFKNAVLSATPSSMSDNPFPYPGATPSISANGAKNGIVWVVDSDATAAVLRAYSAVNVAKQLYSSSAIAGGRDAFGPGNKFMVPTVANGMVYVGTPTGVAGFGLLPAPK